MVNLDYRKGKIDLSDLNSDVTYDANTAFNQSQLANMLILGELGKKWSEENFFMYQLSFLTQTYTYLP